MQDVGSKAEISLDGKALEKNKEYKISVGQELKIGDDALYQVSSHFALESLAEDCPSFEMCSLSSFSGGLNLDGLIS